MLLDWIRYMKGYVRVRLSGYAPERFLNLCSSRNILVWDIEKQSGCYIMKMSISGFRKIRPLAKKTKTKITIQEKRGLPFFVFRNRKRKAFFAGILLCAAMLYQMSLYIWDIRIEGCEQYTPDMLMGFLEKEQIVHGMKKTNVDSEEIQFLLRNAYDRITWASVSIQGTRLLIQIKENTVTGDFSEKVDYHNEEDISEENKGEDLLAPADGVITNMIVRKGTPVKRVGDTVTKGEVLVRGEIEILADYGDVVRHAYCKADADILIEYEKSYVKEQKRTYKKRIYTGQKKYGIVVKIKDYGIRLQPSADVFEMYDHVTVLHQVRILDHFYLPLYWGYDTYREYYWVNARYDEDEIGYILDEQMKEEIEVLKKKGLQIIENNVKIQIDESRGVASGYFLVRERANDD